MKLLLKNVTLLPEYGFEERAVNLVIKDRKIAEITETIPEGRPFDEEIDGQGNLLIPAFYNAHSHVAMTLFRGYGEDLPLKRWLDEKILPAEDRMTFRSTYYASKLAIAEMLKAGIASFSDTYFFEDATAEAVLETGIKANLSRSVVSFDADVDCGNDSRVNEAIRLAEWYHRSDDDRLLVEMGLHAEYTNVPKMCSYVADLAKRFRTGIQLHLSETEGEQEKCLRKYGKTPTEFFRDTGVLDVPVTAAHGVWLTDGDLEILKEKGTTLVHNPVSNLKLGSGVMPIRKILDRGINVALGTDGAASNNRLDILREIQTAALIHKGVNRDPAILSGRELFRMATVNGAQAQGRKHCGEIKEGYCADLVLIDRNALHNLPCYDPYTMIAYSMERSDVLMTMVDGRILYRNGEYTSIDEERLRYDCREVFAHYFE